LRAIISVTNEFPRPCAVLCQSLCLPLPPWPSALSPYRTPPPSVSEKQYEWLQAQAGQAKHQRGESTECLTPEPAVGDDPEAVWGRRPARIAGTGVMHSERKLLGALRKYIAFYAELLSKSGDLDTLQVSAWAEGPKHIQWGYRG
jgi:hypothetical protein